MSGIGHMVGCNVQDVRLEPGAQPNVDDPPEVTPDEMNIDHDTMRPLREHNPWNAPDPDEGDIGNYQTYQFNTGGGGHGTFTFQRTYTTGFGVPRQRNAHADPVADEIMRDFQSMVGNMLGGMGGTNVGGTFNINGRTGTFGNRGAVPHHDEFPGPTMGGPPGLFSMLFPGSPQNQNRNGQRQMQSPLDLLGMLLNPANARSGDAVFSQEALDRVVSQLMEQNQQNGAPPAPEEIINSLPRKAVDKTMLGDDDKAECSICMDNVEMGTEVTVLPCKHWFHFECIQHWLKEHDTCPHCRKPITPEDQRHQQGRPSGMPRMRRRSNSVASPMSQMPGSMPQDGSRQYQSHIPESPSDIRAAREAYYGRSQNDPNTERPSSARRSSRRSDGDGGGGGGVSGWIRSHMPFS
ncbi:hypothetical protein LTR05_003209 [Lithohypha guttulata]|uniref:RING-type E3 ubiquitin transferase n=1 Tax=Lithohypha guttulata TaxID=1690604 RepID=A0AAN7T484_9EURO|nr:hypothetical protein LTR05_003209 [Lithohypha guttulata]